MPLSRSLKSVLHDKYSKNTMKNTAKMSNGSDKKDELKKMECSLKDLTKKCKK